MQPVLSRHILSGTLYGLLDFRTDQPLTLEASEKECIEEAVEALAEDFGVDLHAAMRDVDLELSAPDVYSFSWGPAHYMVLEALRCILDRDYREAVCTLLLLLKVHYKERS